MDESRPPDEPRRTGERKSRNAHGIASEGVRSSCAIAAASCGSGSVGDHATRSASAASPSSGVTRAARLAARRRAVGERAVDSSSRRRARAIGSAGARCPRGGLHPPRTASPPNSSAPAPAIARAAAGTSRPPEAVGAPRRNEGRSRSTAAAGTRGWISTATTGAVSRRPATTAVAAGNDTRCDPSNGAQPAARQARDCRSSTVPPPTPADVRRSGAAIGVNGPVEAEIRTASGSTPPGTVTTTE